MFPLFLKPVLFVNTATPAHSWLLKATLSMGILAGLGIELPRVSGNEAAQPSPNDRKNATDNSSAKSEQASPEQSREAMARLLKELETSEEAMKKVTAYTATFIKEEEVDGNLQQAETIDLKLRHQPFSVYMRWNDGGQEVLFVEGQNDGKLVVKPTGLAGLIGSVRVDPNSKDAMKNSRYPITEAGIARLVARIRKFYSNPAALEGVTCKYSEQKKDNYSLDVFEVVFKDRQQSRDYQSSRLIFDQKSKILISVENFGWPKEEGKESTIVERYQFRDLDFTTGVSDADFDQKNPNYKF